MYLGIGLGITRLSGVLGFNPASLFANGEEGAWYDPSDLTTLYQDAAGTTPVTGTGQPVGLMLDKSKGLTLGSELVTNGTFDTASDWTLGTGWSIASGLASKSPGTGSNISQLVSLSAGATYRVEFTVSAQTAGSLQPKFIGGTNVNGQLITSDGSYVCHLSAVSGNNTFALTANGGFDGSVDNISIRELPGNHATQTTSAARPVLQIANGTPVLSGSELVTNGTFDTDTSGWTGVACTLSQNAGVLRITDTDGSIGYARQAVAVQVNKTYRVSADVVTDAITGPMYLYVGTSDGGSQLFSVNLSSGTGTLSGVFTATTTTAWVSLRNATAVAGEYWEVDNISIQEVTAWTGGQYYLDFDGVDDWMTTGAFASTQAQPNSIGVGFKFDDFSAPTGPYIYDSPSALSTGPRHMLYDYGNNTAVYAGIIIDGGASQTANSEIALVIHDSPSSIFRRDGTQVATGDTGIRDWGGINLMANNFNNIFADGRIYSFVGVNRTLTSGEIDDLETYLAAKSGVTLP